MRHFIYAIVSAALFTTAGCGLDDAAESLADDLNDLTKTEGPEACYDLLESIYSDLNSLEGCSDTPVIGEGETAESLAQAWCDENCSDLSSKIEYSDESNCTGAIYSLECEDLKAFVEGTALPSECDWMESDLGC